MTTLLGLRSPERRRESACSVDRVSTVSEANTAGTGSSAARARRPPPPEAPLERRARTSLLSSEDIKAFVESRGKHRGETVIPSQKCFRIAAAAPILQRTGKNVLHAGRKYVLQWTEYENAN